MCEPSASHENNMTLHAKKMLSGPGQITHAIVIQRRNNSLDMLEVTVLGLQSQRQGIRVEDQKGQRMGSRHSQ